MAVNLRSDTQTRPSDGMRQAIRHLRALRHRRIGYLGDREDIWAIRERFDGFTDAFAADGLVPEPALIRHGLRSRSDATRAAIDLMRLPAPPTALFASNDLVTMGTVDALYSSRQQRGTVALVGFDEFALADKLSPPVTVVAQDPTTIGATAAQLLFGRIAGDISPTREVVLLTRLVVRGSGEIAPASA